MLRIAAAEDLTALTRLRRAATGDSAEDAAGWLQRVAGLENILLLEKPGAPPALMLAAVPVHYAHRKGIWFTGLAADKGVPADKLLPKLLEGALRAFAENGCDFAVMTPDTAADASHLADLGFKNLLPLRVVSKPIRRNLLAQAQFDSLTVRHLMERRLRCQPGCITLPEIAMNEMMTQLYRRGLTVVSDRRGYGLYYTCLLYTSRSRIFKPRIAVCVPAQITGVEADAVVESVMGAGAKQVFLVDEPVAAALGAGLQIREPHGCMVVDIGGGSTDIAVISMGGRVKAASVPVAGNAFDRCIAQYVQEKFQIAIGPLTAEALKKQVACCTRCV